MMQPGIKVNIYYDDLRPGVIGQKTGVVIECNDFLLKITNNYGAMEVIPWHRIVRVTELKEGGERYR